jgi:hypothetical protein
MERLRFFSTAILHRGYEQQAPSASWELVPRLYLTGMESSFLTISQQDLLL